MGVPWSKKLSGRAEVLHFPVTNGPVMLLAPNRAGVPIYGQPQPTVVFMPPSASVIPPLPPPPRPPRPTPAPLPVFYNTEQICTYTCPDGTTGDPVSYTVNAGTYPGTSQDRADERAMLEACEKAAALREATPCEGEGPDPVCSIECQYKEGVATLVGCNEWPFGSPSNPARRFRRFRQGGSSSTGSYATGACSGSPGLTVTCLYSEYIEYDALTGIATQGGDTVCNGISLGQGTICVATHPNDDCLSFWTIDSKTLMSRHSTGTCCDDNGTPRRTDSESLTFNLEEEDTDQAAEDRRVLSIAEWTSVACDETSSYREPRSGTTDIEFNFRRAQTRVIFGAVDNPLIFGHLYEATVGLERRIYGSGDPFTPFGELTMEAEADEPVVTGAWVDIPNATGFETRVTSCSIEDVTP